MHLQVEDTAKETMKAKHAFKKYAAEHGVSIKHYHCNNGHFTDNLFKQSCESNCQWLTFCGFNAHFHNGILERAIRDLSDSACKQLFHARSQWPAAVHFALW